MSKRLYFLISFVLVLSLSGLAQADAIEVNNPSFELNSDGNQQTCGGDALAWEEGGSGFVGTNIDSRSPVIEEGCGGDDVWEDVNTTLTGGQMPDGYSHLYFQVGSYIYQILDMNNSDANAVIEVGRKYTLKWDGLAWDDSITATFFYGNNPDANEIASTTQSLVQSGETPWDYFPGKLAFVAEPSQDYLTETLGLKFTPGGDGYVFIDNVRLEWSWSSAAYDPDPADGAEDVPIDVNLSWGPGLWAVSDVNGHEVYFGTSESEVADANTNTAGIYRGSGVGVVSGPDANNRYSYDGLETLELGKTYYWRIDEVNEDWVSGPVPPVNDRWKGDVWSFRTAGFAYNVYPADGAVDIPALDLLLRWEAGVGAGGHNVYFGTSKADVEDANTANTALYPGVYRDPTQSLADVNYLVEPLEVGKTYYWRIDEVNAVTVKGDVWSFTTGSFLFVETFEPYWYVDTTALREVWKDYYANPGLNHAEVKIWYAKTDANKVIDEQSMEFAYRCYEKSGSSWIGSYAEAALPLEVGTDWTVAGVKALVVNFYGDLINGTDHNSGYEYDIIQDQMWVELEDGDANAGIVKLPDMTDVKEESWHTWDISLQDPNFSDVNLANVAKVYIGFGGDKGGQSKIGAGGPAQGSGKHDTVWFDDISLYPPRCMPSVTGKDVLRGLGDIGGGGEEGIAQDCNTNYLDLEIMARDWASIDGLANTENRPAVLTGFPDTSSHWVTGFDGNNAIEVNEGYKITVDDPRLFGLESMSITAWVKQTIDNSWVGIVSSREGYPGCGDDSTEIGIYGKLYGGPDGLGYDWSCGTEEWQWDAKLDVPEDGTWTFVAVSVDPTGATLYMQPYGESLQIGLRNEEVHDVQKNFAESFIIGRSDLDSGYLVGAIDDVRIYGYNLDDANVALLAGGGEPNPPPVYWYKFDEDEGLIAADSGTPIEVYTMNMSPANLVSKDPNESEDPNLGSRAFDPNNLDIVNFRDYADLTEHWLDGPYLWPPQP